MPFCTLHRNVPILIAPQELSAGSATPPLLNQEGLDRALVARIIEHPPADHPQPPFHYLLSCYARASQELRALSVKAPGSHKEALIAVKELAVSYAGACNDLR